MCMLLAFIDKVSIQNVMNITRILVNHDIQEAIDFKNGYVTYMIGHIPLGHQLRRVFYLLAFTNQRIELLGLLFPIFFF